MKKMCDIYRSTPCHVLCPNAEHPPKVYTCSLCSDDIRVGDEYVETKDGYYHFECIDNLTTREIIELLGGCIGEAEGYIPVLDD